VAWSVIQSASAASSGIATTKAVTFATANLSSGTKIIALVSASSGTPSITSVKDGAGNTLTLITSVTLAGKGITGLFAMDTPAGDVGSKPTITATLGVSGETSILVQEVSGLATGNTVAAMIDGTSGHVSGLGGSSTGSPSYTSSTTSEYMVACYGDDGGPETWTAPSGLTADAASVNSSSQADVAIAYGNSTGGTEAGSWAITGSSADWIAILTAFQLAGGGGATSGTATLTGAGALTALGTVPGTGTASLVGAGTLTAAATMIGVTIPVWTVAVDWNGNGSFTDAGDDISKDALDTAGATIQYGRDQARAVAAIAPASAGFLIDNASRNYSPDNAASTLTPNVRPRRPVRISAVQNATTYVKYRGFLETYDVNSQDHTVNVGCSDALAGFASLTLSTPLYFSITTGQAIGHILDALGWTGGRDLDAGATMIRWWWEEGTDGLSALQKVLDSEGPPAIAYIDEDTGNFAFRDRSHRLVRIASKTSQATWADSGPDSVPVFGPPFTYDLGWQGIINSVTIPADDREISGATSVVWQDSTGGTTSIAPGGTAVVIAQGADPFTAAITPSVATGDWVQQSGTTTAALSRTSGQSVTITYTDGGSGSVISALQLQAYSVPVARTTQVAVADATSIGQYGIRSLGAVSRFPVWAGLNDAAAIAAMILAQRAQRLPIISVTFEGGGNTLVLTQQLARNLSDRVTVTEYETGLANVDFFVEQIGHVISAGGAWLTTTFGCERAPVTSLAGQNAGFEGGIGTWTSGGNANLSGTSAQSHSGASSMAMSSQASGNMSCAHCADPQILTAGVSCTPNGLVQCSAWLRAAVSARSVQCGAAFYNAAGTFLSIVYGSTVADSSAGWTQATAALTAPGGAVWCNARVQVLATGGAAEVHYVDDVVLATASPFIFNDATYGRFDTGGGFGI
jgi:hypothetical protein